MATSNLLRIEGISKSFGPTSVLKDVSFDVPTGSVVGLVGENGAGKSTLFNILTGLIRPDSGKLYYKGQPYHPQSYKDAFAQGVSRVFQEQALIQNAPVYENLVLSQEHRFTRFGQFVDARAMIKTANQIVEAAGIDVDVTRPIGSYDFSKRQSLEIARACVAPRYLMGIEDPLVLLDEPTSALDRADENAFFDLLKRLRKHATFLFVSHRLTEVRDISDIIHVLKDGELTGSLSPEEADEQTLHGLMVGRAREHDYYHARDQRTVDDEPIVCRVRGLTGQSYEDVSLDLRAGEIIGIGGLLDSGKSELGKGIAGVRPPAAGTVALADLPACRPDIATFIRNGLGYVPAERSVEGIIAALNLAINLTLPSADRYSPYGVWRRRQEIRAAERAVEEMRIQSGSPFVPMANLSGGNQQKVVLARWLQRDLKLLILDNPTRGVDAGAKEEIYGHLRRLTQEGVGLIVITDELTELIGLANRILIMRHGTVATELTAPGDSKPTEHDLIPHMLSGPV